LNWHFSLFEVLVLIGIVQGSVIAVLIWLGKTHSLSRLLLSAVIMVFNFLCVKILIHTTGLWHTPVFRYLPLAFDLAIQPLLWLYTLSLTHPGLKLQKKHALHLLPFALSMAYSLFVYLAVLPQKDLALKDVIANSYYFNPVKEVEDFLSILSGLFYWILSLRLVIQYRRWLNDNISDTDYPTYTWLRNITFLLGVLFGVLTVSILLDYLFQFGSRSFIHWQLFFGYLAIIIYYLGFKGYQLPVKQATITEQPMPELVTPSQVQSIQEPVDGPAPPVQVEQENINTGKGLSLTPEKIQQVTQLIRAALETRKLYLDPELSLQKLAKEIKTPTAIVSAVINKTFQKPFRNLINDYRITEVKERFRDPRSNQFSILGIAYECGFNSEASFYRIFKASVGLSPKEYLDQQSPSA
jgi:AraC-like DNA-binding protein